MQPMGNDKPANFPGRQVSPVLASPQASSPFMSSSPQFSLGGQGTSIASQAARPFSFVGTVMDTQTLTPNYKVATSPLMAFDSLTLTPPPLSYRTQDVSMYQLTQAPRLPPPAQPLTSSQGPPILVSPQHTMPFSFVGRTAGMQTPSHTMSAPPPVVFNALTLTHPPSFNQTQVVSTYPQTQAPRHPLPAQPAIPLEGLHAGPPVVPQGTMPFSSVRPTTSTWTPNYNIPVPPPVMFNGSTSTPPPSYYRMQDVTTHPETKAPTCSQPAQCATLLQGTHRAPPLASTSESFQMAPPPRPYLRGSSNVPPPYYTNQGGVTPLPPPTIGTPLGFSSREQMQFPYQGAPSTGPFQNLVEEFESLSVLSAPSSLSSGVDAKLLPRPLNSDEEPTKILESYPLNCHPRYFRLTTHAIPSSQSLLARWHLPLGAVVHPLAEVPEGEEVPIINFGPAGIVRCQRCRAYINPYVTFIDAGRRWRCNLCSLLNDVPGEYYCPLDATGRRYDIDQRLELSKGSVEFVAPTEYMERPPMPPSYFFLIDVSVSATKCGVLEIIVKTIKSCLDDLPGYPRTKIGFLTFDSTLHFHNLKPSIIQPQMMVVTDLDDVFLPLPDDLLANLVDSRHVVDAFLDNLPSMFQENTNLESALGPALKAASIVMSQIGGKLLVFQSTLPSLGVGQLKLREDDPRIYGTEKEHTLRIPEDPFYKQMAIEFTKFQISVDIYAFGGKYIDISSLGSLAKYSGGQVYHYPLFQAATHQDKLRYELARDITRETAWEAMMRLRCGEGVCFSTFHGHFLLKSTHLVVLPTVDCDKAFAVQLSLQDALITAQTVYFQVALLASHTNFMTHTILQFPTNSNSTIVTKYTSSSGQRRVRVHTAAVPVVNDLGEMYRQADTGAIISLLSRLAIQSTMFQKLDDARQLVQMKLVRSFKEYRNLFAVQHRLGGRLIFPESLKFLPLYILCLCKYLALRGDHADVTLDERCAAGYTMMILPIKRIVRLLYPCFYRIDEILTEGSDNFKSLEQLPLTAECLNSGCLYVLDDGSSFVIWLGRSLSSDLPDKLIEVQLLEQENEKSRKLMRLLNSLREKDPSIYQLCRFVIQGEQREGSLLLSKLVEDQTAGASSYADWILQIYRQTQGF